MQHTSVGKGRTSHRDGLNSGGAMTASGPCCTVHRDSMPRPAHAAHNSYTAPWMAFCGTRDSFVSWLQPRLLQSAMSTCSLCNRRRSCTPCAPPCMWRLERPSPRHTMIEKFLTMWRQAAPQGWVHGNSCITVAATPIVCTDLLHGSPSCNLLHGAHPCSA